MRLACLFAVTVLMSASPSWGQTAATSQAAEAETLLSSFEPGGPGFAKGTGKAVREHATHGERAFKVDSDGKGYMGIRITDPAVLGKLKDYVLYKVDVFNPQDRPVGCGARIDGAGSRDYGSRYNDDNLVVPPGTLWGPRFSESPPRHPPISHRLGTASGSRALAAS